jgi:diguanylate cyclase (GGDEF)-like protein/PAS domain S-box-containing protein
LFGHELAYLILLLRAIVVVMTTEILLGLYTFQSQVLGDALIEIFLLMLVPIAVLIIAKKRSFTEEKVCLQNSPAEQPIIELMFKNQELITCSQQLKETQHAKQELEIQLSELKEVEKALRESEERYALAAVAGNEGLWDWNLKTNQVYFSPAWKSLLGYEDSEIGNHPDEWFSRVHPEEIERVKVELATHAEGVTSSFKNAYPMLHKDGTYHWMLSKGIAVKDTDGKTYRIAGVQTDITERKLAEEQLVYDAFHDGLTGLPNRSLFRDRLSHIMEVTKRREDYLFAVLFLDFDRFKVINDSLGHLVGDQLLIAIAHRLTSCLRAVDTVARFGGDEFAILLEDLKNANAAIEVADRIQQELALPFNLNQQEVFTTTSIGIALSSTGYTRPEDFLRDADTAMYRAKALGKSRYVVFDQAMHTRAVTLLQLENDLRRAIERQQFQIHYQPIVSLKSGILTGFEALVRWQHPDCGLISPVEFIPLAEETGLIIPIGAWVLREACRQMRIWQELFPTHSPLTMSVNLSAKQFSQPDLIGQIVKILQETQLDARSLKLEITESVILENAELTAQMLEKLQALGIRLSIDDFGTGYSSLSYLHRLPINTLKIDRCFIENVDVDLEKLELVRTILTLAWNLGMDVIAEGVETTGQLAQLRGLECESGQGYFFSRPVDSQTAAGLIAKSLNL